MNKAAQAILDLVRDSELRKDYEAAQEACDKAKKKAERAALRVAFADHVYRVSIPDKKLVKIMNSERTGGVNDHLETESRDLEQEIDETRAEFPDYLKDTDSGDCFK